MPHSIQNRSFLLLLTGLLLLASYTWAQTDTSSLHGKVADSSRAVIDGARVTIANQAQAISREATTSSTADGSSARGSESAPKPE